MRRTWLEFIKTGSSAHWRPSALVALIALTPLITYSQSTPAADRLEKPQLIALVQAVRANPREAGKLAEARAVGFELLRAARFAEAVEIFDAIVDGVPIDGLALYGGAVALFNLRRLEEAERVARDAVRISVAATAKPAGSLIDIERAKEQAAEALTLLGVILAVKGNSAGALTAVTKAAALAPKNFDAQFALGRALFGTGNPGGAANAFRTAVALRPQDTKARFFLATALETAGDYENALSQYRELVNLDSSNAEGYLGLGVLLVKLGGEKVRDGIEQLSRALALNGDLYEARIAIGRALIQQGRPGEAVEHLQRAIELSPKNPEPHYQLALAYRRLGKTQEAMEQEAIIQKLHAERRGE
jgi:tetratricopeptide (TPR) repeat protein